MQINDLSYKIIGCAIKVHKNLGPGLLESTYEACLYYELNKSGLAVARQVLLPVTYGEVTIDAGYRIDLLVEDLIILELKATNGFDPIHKAQLITYLKLSGLSLGLLINFNSVKLMDGIIRIIN